ncbi:Rab11 family-interacting protein 1 [Dissostichus eleginoides]|uniref:Rab11 family-interacting protein 1 n=1 Tax=Dissostichus eleginoides TaxID=100907 RepID=A0AAD9F065_DISEL|nr:Rab11 family-interacting protein 1 [Dissostichus eleginoides]
MSLADLQWCPTSVQVTVLQSRGLRIKGKNGTNDAYAIMQVGKEKFQTSVVEKSVAPVWKEEAAFDLPPPGRGGPERGTLHVHVLHRALVGPDKLLGQAVINLLELSEDKTRSKTEWFKLLDKTGKADKDRGEVLVDIQFMRNNMTASMFDISAAGKSKSRLGKFKDKVRGKKKESDAASNMLPSFSQVLTDSEEEGNGEVTAGKDDKKKKHKIKSLFSTKSNLQRNMSQSMSILPAKNSSLSGSQSSGLNVDSSEGKKKFKFMIHKRSGSSDSKDSGHQKQGAAEQSNLCINGSHVYREEPPPRSSRIGSNFSLTSSGQGSMEDVPENSPPSVDSLRAVRQYSPWTEEEEEEEVENMEEDVEEQREEEERIKMEKERSRKLEEEQRVRKQEEELESLAEEKRLEEEKRREEERVRKEEEDRIRREEEEERALEERRRQEEGKRREEERVRKEEEDRIRREEEEERAQEERRRQEEEERERLVEVKRRQEEQERIAEEKVRKEEEERTRMEEEETAQEERRRQEEEERERLAEEKRRLEEQERIEEEKVRKEEEERIRMEEKRVEEERRRGESEERARRQEDELAEEKRRLEEQRQIEEEGFRKEEEKRIRREQESAEEEKRKREEEGVVRSQDEEHEKKEET